MPRTDMGNSISVPRIFFLPHPTLLIQSVVQSCSGQDSSLHHALTDRIDKLNRALHDRDSLLAAKDEIARLLRADLKKLEDEYDEFRQLFTTVEHSVSDLRVQLRLKDQEIQRLGPFHNVSGANPYFLNKAVQRVFHALSGFVLSMQIPNGKPSTDMADLSKYEALVSSVLFSNFERVDFGVVDAATFIPPPQLPKLSFQDCLI